MSSMSTSKAQVTLGLNQKEEIQPYTAYTAQEVVLSHNHMHRPERFSAPSVTNRPKIQTLTHVSQTRHMLCVLFQVILLVQLPTSVALLRLHQVLQKAASLKPPSTPESAAKDESQGYKTSPCGLTFPLT